MVNCLRCAQGAVQFPAQLVASIAVFLTSLGGQQGAIAAEARTAELVNAQAVFTYDDDEFCINNPRLQIKRSGELVFDQALSEDEELCRLNDLQVVHLNADEEPEVILDLYSGGAHCCFYSKIYQYDAASSQYEETEHFWGNVGYQLQDLDQDGIPEFKSADDRFAYQFSAYAASRFPLQIWQFQSGAMQNVTREFPQLVYSDAYQLWVDFARNRNEEYDGVLRSTLAAYLADKYLLGQEADGWQRVQQAYQRSDRLEFFADLRQFLRETGYMP